MRKFVYKDSKGVESTITEKEILDMYWETWSEAMWQDHPDPYFITEDACIDDWVLTYWAEEIIKEV